nr:hypothetical protein [Tanacetum cinerariifolium]
MTIDQQVALDEALVPHASRLRIDKSNFRLRSDIKSKESTLQVVYDVLKLTPFYKAFLVIIDVPLIYMQEFWETVTVHHHSIRLKMNNKKLIVEHKDAKKSNEMYYPRFTKVIVNFFMTKDQSILKRNKYSVILSVELTNKAIKHSESYKEYYAVASGAEHPKIKASVRKKQSSSDTTVPPPTKGKILKISAKVDKPAKEKQPAKSSTKGLTVLSEVALTEAEQIKLATKKSLTQMHISHASGLGADEGTDDDEDSDGIIVKGDEGANEENDADELYRDVNINLKGQQESSFVSSLFVSNMLNPSADTGIDFIFDSTPRVDVPVSTAAEPPLLSATTLPLPSISIIPHVQQTIALSPANVLSSSLQDLPKFGSLFGFDHRLKTLETNFSEFLQTNQFAKAVFSILGIVDRYIDHRMNKDVKVTVRLQSDRLQDEAQAENEDFLKKLDENIQKLIKEQVKEQVKVQVSKILPKIEKTVNEQLEAEVLTCSSNSFKTSYAIAIDLSKLELKKILIEKMESNKSIHRSDEQKNLYKALVDTYECDKLILDTYGDTVILKRRRDDEDKDEESFTGSNRGAWNKTLPATHGRIQPWINNLAKKADSRTSFNELMVDFLAFMMNRLKVDTLTPELLAGPTYELMKGSRKSVVELKYFLDRGRHVIPFDHFINNDFEYLRGGASSQKHTTSVTKTKAADYGHIKWIKDLFYGFAANKESARDVYSKRRIIAVTELQIVEWHNYKHLDWINVRRDDDKLDKFKEGDFKRLRIQDIKDMLLLLFSDDTLNDVRTALDDHLKGIKMQYLPQTIWRRSDKDRAAAMIQAIDRQLKTRRIMHSLEKFVGGRLYEGDFRLLKRTI